ncbi:GntR family transcriptional regulator [Streptomyces gamaensis]|uniref:GntR family transcriptional regulator n=1 Tax=Streptomyces gamaensis TaxID=1763542 RepID=A0ABW0YV60_9ACTN
MEQGRPRTARYRPRTGAGAEAEAAREVRSRAEEAYGEHVRGEHVHVRGEHVHDGRAPAPGPVRPRPPQRYSVRGQVLDALRRALVSGELTPGEVYSGPALGERFGVSATPVREAMQQLAQEGAVEVVPNRGFRVTCRTARDLAELAEVRALLEVPAVLRLARTLPAARCRELVPLAEAACAAAAAGDRVRYAEADRAFHRALLAHTGNRQLVAVADELHRRAQWPPAPGEALPPTDLTADAQEHLTLLDALAARDLDTVERVARGHFASAR